MVDIVIFKTELQERAEAIFESVSEGAMTFVLETGDEMVRETGEDGDAVCKTDEG